MTHKVKEKLSHTGLRNPDICPSRAALHPSPLRRDCSPWHANLTAHPFHRGVGLAMLFVWLTSPALAIDVRGTLWDGAAFSGQWLTANAGVIHIQSGATESKLSLDDIATVEFPTPLRAPSGPMAFYLHDGGVLYGNLLAGQTESVRAETLAGPVNLPWTQLAAIRLAEPTQFKRASELFDDARRNRSPSQDRIVSRDHADVKVIEGRLESFSESGGAFVFSGESRKFQNSKLYGVVFAAGATRPSVKPVRVALADGSMIFADLVSGSGETLRLQTSFAGSPVEIPLADIRGLNIRSSRVVFLSAIDPSSQRTEGVLHAPQPIGVDRNVQGDPIIMGGRTFERGVGVHSRTEVSYPLGGAYEQFAATIGIDDAVRPYGSVIMVVKGDGRVLFDSGLVTGDMPTRDILVDVAGVQTLTLLVDYGEGLDASDQANWGDARLLRPFSTKGKGDRT